MNAILIVLLPLLFLVGFEAGRSVEVKQTEELRASITASWLQSCDINKERGKR